MAIITKNMGRRDYCLEQERRARRFAESRPSLRTHYLKLADYYAGEAAIANQETRP